MGWQKCFRGSLSFSLFNIFYKKCQIIACEYIDKLKCYYSQFRITDEIKQTLARIGSDWDVQYRFSFLKHDRDGFVTLRNTRGWVLLR